MTNEIKYIRVSNELYHYGMPRRSGRYPYGSGDRPYQSSGGTAGGVSSKDQKTSWRAKRLKKVQEKATKKEAEAKEKAKREAEAKRYGDIDEVFSDAQDAWDNSPQGKKMLDEYWEVHERVFKAEHPTDKMWDELDKAEEKYLRASENAGIKAIRQKYNDDDLIFYANNLYNTRWQKQTTQVKTVDEALKFIEDRWRVHRE